jgi:hypothetical protein
MRKTLLAVIAVLAITAAPAFAGEWHAGTTNLCSDCHTMHFSMQHDWTGASPVSTTPQSNGNWIGNSGPNMRLLKLPANELCKTCHDGQTFAPDVVSANTNASPSRGRSAGALNELGDANAYMGHTLGSTATPPGFNPTGAGVPATSAYVAANGLECISCHLQHGSQTVYRNLGPRTAAFQPTYTINATNDTTKDVWVAIPAGYTANSGSAATFNPYYDAANIGYNKTNPAKPAGSLMQTSNRMDTFCSACHGDFHGGPTDANIGASISGVGAQDFIRHPTSVQVIGLAANGGQSSLTRFVAGTTKVPVYTSDRVLFADATPGCVTCHKAHGNQNPFALNMLSRNASSVNEEGGFGAAQTHSLKTGYRNLCGQCHGQGSDGIAD